MSRIGKLPIGIPAGVISFYKEWCCDRERPQRVRLSQKVDSSIKTTMRRWSR